MKTFLVTGGSGFIGYNICKLLINKGYNVISFLTTSQEKAERNK